ncbi:MAG TPA: hypothetical protein VMU75_16050 [Acidimicrobiales bacterium]|nr:hypothetical protein [Acidimicrobiales bacterium]
MVSAPAGDAGDTTRSPIVALAVGAIVTAFVSVGYIAAYMPRNAPLAVPVALLVASGVMSLGAIVLLTRLRRFAWHLFFNVARWVLALTFVFAAMAEYVFAYDDTRGTPLVILTVVLILAAVNIPVVLGFSVARHERVAG